MDFLTLCQAVARESQTLAGAVNFTTVVNAQGRAGQIVGWTREAYIDIQNERTDWKWMRQRFEADLIIDTARYPKASLNLPRMRSPIPDYRHSQMWHRTMTLYDPDKGREDEGDIRFIPYELWEEQYDRGTHNSDRPTEWSVSPQREVLFGKTPDKAYKVRGMMRVTPQVLALDADEPEMPEDFHRVIVFEAIRLMSRSDEAFNALTVNTDEYTRLRNALVIDQTPDVLIR